MTSWVSPARRSERSGTDHLRERASSGRLTVANMWDRVVSGSVNLTSPRFPLTSVYFQALVLWASMVLVG